MKTKVVYITGCLGFIGSYVTKACLEKGWYVLGVDKCTYAHNPEMLEEFQKYSRFKFSKRDINDLEFLHDCDYVINTAAETHVGNSIVKSDDFVSSNINGVYHLLELHAKSRGKLVEDKEEAESVLSNEMFNQNYVNILKYMGI